MSTHVYRLVVKYPPGSEEPWRTGWAPEGWVAPDPSGDPDDGWREEFRWPQVRLYLSKSGAEGRANLLRSYGAEVTVERSEAVVWLGGAP